MAAKKPGRSALAASTRSAAQAGASGEHPCKEHAGPCDRWQTRPVVPSWWQLPSVTSSSPGSLTRGDRHHLALLLHGSQHLAKVAEVLQRRAQHLVPAAVNARWVSWSLRCALCKKPCVTRRPAHLRCWRSSSVTHRMWRMKAVRPLASAAKQKQVCACRRGWRLESRTLPNLPHFCAPRRRLVHTALTAA